jgi:hypothetical protein
MKGQRRRQIVQDYYATGKLEELGDSLLTDSLDDEARKRLGLIHPTFMGGEYLPDYSRRELEIVRIELESTTYDVISLRARPVGSKIEYNLVDEYESEFTLPQHTSRRPFSLCQLIHFLDSIQRIGTGEPSCDQRRLTYRERGQTDPMADNLNDFRHRLRQFSGGDKR